MTEGISSLGTVLGSLYKPKGPSTCTIYSLINGFSIYPQGSKYLIIIYSPEYLMIGSFGPLGYYVGTSSLKAV